MHTESESGPDWPIVARDSEYRRAVLALDDSAPVQGVALVGESGVGKSTLARKLGKALESDRHTVRYVLGTQTGGTVPLGAFSRSVTIGAAHEPASMLAAARKTLEQEENLVIVVDDAQLLDQLSAALVYQLAASGSARLIVTIRSGDAVLDAVTALWKEKLLSRIDIDAFTRSQTEELARAALGGAVDSQLVAELYHRTAGNPLMLRSLLSAGRDSGVLRRTEAGWRLHGQLHGDSELYDLLDFQLRALAPEELEAVEILAAGELLDWEVLRGLSDADAVARLERRGLIQLVADESHTVARLMHPLLGEAAIRMTGAVRSRQLNSMLAQALRKHLQAGGRRLRLPDVRGRIRMVQFMIRSDLPPDLGVIVEAAASAMAMSNFVCGAEFARFAFDRGGGLSAGLVLAEALSWQGRGAEAEAILSGVDPGDSDELLTARWGCARAMNLFFNCGQVENAQRVITELKERIESAGIVGLVTALELSFVCLSGDVATVAEQGPAVCGSAELPLATAWAATPTCWALALAGRSDEVNRIADAGRRATAPDQVAVEQFIVGLAETVAATLAGDYPAAQRIQERYATMAAATPVGNAITEAMLGLVQLARGALPSAGAAFRHSMSALSDGFPWVWSMLVAVWCAQAEGARGDSAAAAAALRISEQNYGPQAAVLLPELELARAWERASAGQLTAARMHAVRAAEIAQQSGMVAVELHARHAAVRFGDTTGAARLDELAKTLNTALAKAMAAHARGVTGDDGDLLDVAAAHFTDLGALALAADAAAHAATAHARRGERAKEVESSARAYRLAGQCGLRTPATDAAAGPLPISEREHEIAMLVASGLSNRQIAERLVVSVRTVDGHLYRIFVKLGINSRDQLIHLMHLIRPDEWADGS